MVKMWRQMTIVLPLLNRRVGQDVERLARALVVGRGIARLRGGLRPHYGLVLKIMNEPMWIIFRDPNTVFNHIDKFVSEIVEDDDIEAYQAKLLSAVGGVLFEFHPEGRFAQKFVRSKDDVEYFARKYKVWSK